MAIQLRLENYLSKIPISVGGILPETSGSEPEDLKRRSIWVGNRQVELGQLFEISDVDTIDSDNGVFHQTHIWQGDLSKVHEIGLGLREGTIQIKGNAGRHVGARMTGGAIEVSGSVSDFLGAEMSGGQIQVSGDSGDWTGAVYPGTKTGVNGGVILIAGNAGAASGFAMRRGSLVIGGAAGPQVGWNMRAGTILVGSGIEGSFGCGMIRGTIMTVAKAPKIVQQSLGPTFQMGSRLSFPMTSLFQQWLANAGDRLASVNRLLRHETYQIFHGDCLRGGRGEVLIADVD